MAYLDTHDGDSPVAEDPSTDSAEAPTETVAAALSRRAYRRPAGLVSGLAEALQRDGFVHVAAGSLAYVLEQNPAQAYELQQSWNRLGTDEYLDGPKFRRRRYAMYRGEVATGDLTRKPHGPHYQRHVHNQVFGGYERQFLPIEHRIACHPALCELIGVALDVFAAAAPSKSAFHVETHQFRIEPVDQGAGHPTPEGLHRDGRDWVAIFMIHRENVQGGETRICDSATDGEFTRFTMKHTLEAVFINDHDVKHLTTDIRRDDLRRRPAYRDVLVVTFIDEDVAAGEVAKSD